MQSSTQCLFHAKMPEKLLSPVPIRTNSFFLYSKSKSVSKSIDFAKNKKESRPEREFLTGKTSTAHCPSKTFAWLFHNLKLFFSARNSSLDSEDKAGLLIDERDLNGLILLREDSKNPQDRDEGFRCINFEELESVKADLNEAFAVCE